MDKSRWISVDEKLPDIGVHVFVYGELNPEYSKPLIAGMPMRYIWTCKRVQRSGYTDGNGFMRLYNTAHLVITHWLPIPLLNGKEIYETLPV